MTSTTNPLPHERDDTIRMQRWPRPPAVSLAMAWWRRRTEPARTGLAVAAVFAFVGTLSLSASLAQGDRASVVLKPETAAPDSGKIWVATKAWQGSGNKETETFTVTGHWRVDWIFSPSSSSGGVFQVFIYSADGRRLLNLAANGYGGGSDTSFWAGPGTYYLKISSAGGDWKVGVQDLHWSPQYRSSFQGSPVL